MTNASNAPEKFVAATWRRARTTHTVSSNPVSTPDILGLLAGGTNRESLFELQRAIEDRLQDQEQKHRIGERLRTLRERSPYTQEAVADHIGVTIRAYQKQEQTGGVKYENLEKLADLFGVTVSYFYEERPALSRDAQLDRIERKLNALLALGITAGPEAEPEERMRALLAAQSALLSDRQDEEDPPAGTAAAG